MNCLYYTDGLIINKETLTKLCIYFDEVRTFYLSPIYYFKQLEERWLKEREKPFYSKSPVEKELITRVHLNSINNFIKENNNLIKENVVNPIEIFQKPPDWVDFETNEKKIIENGAFIQFGLWGEKLGIVPKDKLYVDSPIFSMYRMQSTSGGLDYAIRYGLIPISDNFELSSLSINMVNKYSDIKYIPAPTEIASQIAFKSMSLIDFPSLNNEEILEVRYKFRDELSLFRQEMHKIAMSIDKEKFDDLDTVVTSQLKPRLDDIKLKIKSLKDELFRKIAKYIFVGSGGSTLLSHFITLTLSEKIIAGTSVAGKMLLDLHEIQSKKYELRNESNNRGLVFLLDFEKKYGKKK